MGENLLSFFKEPVNDIGDEFVQKRYQKYNCKDEQKNRKRSKWYFGNDHGFLVYQLIQFKFCEIGEYDRCNRSERRGKKTEKEDCLSPFERTYDDLYGFLLEKFVHMLGFINQHTSHVFPGKWRGLLGLYILSSSVGCPPWTLSVIHIVDRKSVV